MWDCCYEVAAHLSLVGGRAGVSSLSPYPTPGAATSHLQAGAPQEDHDLIDEAQQGHEHRIPVVKPPAEQESEGDVGGGPAQQGQGEGPAWGQGTEASGASSPQEGVCWPPLTSIAVQLSREAPQFLQDLVSHRLLPHAQAVEGVHRELAGCPPARPRRKEDTCGPDGAQ